MPAVETHAPRGFLIASLIAVLFLSGFEGSALASSKRQRAAKAYNRALQMRAKLNVRHGPPSFRDYSKVVRAFDAVYRLDPGYPNTPRALLAEAQIEQQMGHLFPGSRYFASAAETYRFLIDQYPTATISRDALFTLAEIYRVDLGNSQEAGKTYTEFLTKYPYAPKASQAKLRLKEIARQLDAAAAEGARAAESVSPAPSRVVTVNDIRFWEGPSYTRVVISMEDEAKFQAVRLHHPDRILFDIPGTRLGPSLAGKTFPVGNGFLQQIRVAQYKPDVSRLVLDLEKIRDYSVFSLPNPFRMIIDIHGPAPIVEARVARPPSASSDGQGAVMPSAPVDDTGARSAVTSATLRPSSPPKAEEISAAAKPNAGGPQDVETDLADSASSPSSPNPSDTDSALDAPDTTIGSTRASGAAHPSLAAHTSAGSATLTRALGLKIARIVIDPGHGGHDTGTIGPEGIEEKNVVLDVALRLRRLIQQRTGSQVVMTRSDDTFIPLEERTAIANQRAADLFISIHANASRDASARGIEVYYLNFTSDPNSLEVAARENATSQESVHQLQSLIKKIALTEKIQESADLASQVDHGLAQATARNGNPNRGLKKAPFVVLIGANMPSVLAEISFLTNPRDEHLLGQPQYRQQIAEGLYKGLSRYIANLGSIQIAQRGSRLPTRRVSSQALP